MKVEFAGRTFVVEFHYGLLWDKERSRQTDKTTATIRDFDVRIPLEGDHFCYEALARESSIRDTRDKPNREQGRKAALARALKMLDGVLPVEDLRGRRRAFWEAYHSRKPERMNIHISISSLPSVAVYYDHASARMLAERVADLIGSNARQVRHAQA